MTPPTRYDLAVLWDWEHDRDFIRILGEHSRMHGIRFLSISHQSREPAMDRLLAGEISCTFVLDRATDSDPLFVPVMNALRASGSIFLNSRDKMQKAADKATMHLELLAHGVHVPWTIIIPPYSVQPDMRISDIDLKRLGRPFVIKPANTTGGGTGVFVDALEWKDVQRARAQHPADKYLLQERIVPDLQEERKLWLRVFFVCGKIIPCIWDNETHVYDTATIPGDASVLHKCVETIAQVCGLNFFSTEIVQDSTGKIVAVDYVNETCDMRLQSSHLDGVPDVIVHEIASVLVHHRRQSGFDHAPRNVIAHTGSTKTMSSGT